MGTIRETLERARQALIGGKADQALAPCQEVLGRYPKHLEASCLLAETRRELRQLPQAADLFERVVAADPESLIGHWGLATILEEQGDLEGTLYELECAWDVSPGQAAVAEEVGRLRAALGWAAETVELSSGGLARVYWRGHQYRRALAEARRALARRPERIDLSVLEMECLWRLGRVGEAAEVAADLLAESPDCLKANLVRGYARLEGGTRAAEEGRKLLTRALALDPECLVAATLFPDQPVPAPLVKGEVDLDAEPVALAAPVEVVVTAARARTSLVAEVAVPAPVAAVEPVVEAVQAPALAARVEAVVVEAEPVVAQPLPVAPVVEAEAGDALTLTLSQGERETQVGASVPEDEPVAAVEEPVVVAPVEEEPVAPVPEWLTKNEQPVENEQPAKNGLPGGLDPELYAEWADLLGEEVDLDADAVQRLEAALAEATGGAGSSGAWREVALDGEALKQTVADDGAPTAPPARPPVRAVPPPEPAPLADLPAALDRVRSLAADGDLDRAAEAYRELLRAHAEAARDLVEELCQLVDATPSHGGLRRALGDAYMRSGRFQKAIEEYNRAASAQQPAAVA